MKIAIPVLFLFFSQSVFAQYHVNPPSNHWVDSVFKTLSDTQKIAQLMIVRLSSIDLPSGKISFYDEQVESDIRRFDVGGICLFQGGPKIQAALINRMQAASKTPILFSIDGENGLRSTRSAISQPKLLTALAVVDRKHQAIG